MTAHVNYEGVSCYESSFMFRFNSGYKFRVKSLLKGVLTIELMSVATIEEIANDIAGCFDIKSNFYGFKTIKFRVGGIEISVSKRNANPDAIIKEWYKKKEREEMKFIKKK